VWSASYRSAVCGMTIAPFLEHSHQFLKRARAAAFEGAHPFRYREREAQLSRRAAGIGVVRRSCGAPRRHDASLAAMAASSACEVCISVFTLVGLAQFHLLEPRFMVHFAHLKRMVQWRAFLLQHVPSNALIRP
jgi:hypothetical protein